MYVEYHLYVPFLFSIYSFKFSLFSFWFWHRISEHYRLLLATGYKQFHLSSLRLKFEAYYGLIINTVWTYEHN